MGKSKGGKQSALKQLRSALSNAGITGPTSSSRKVHKKNKGSKPANDRGHKLQAIQAAFNPFEMKIDKTKFDVLGLKRKTQVNVSVARQRALEKRKNTLGQELAKRNRVGGISDRRIGENDPTMDPEEKMVRRFALERQRRSTHAGGSGSGKRSSMFNLEENSDIEGEITSLTHFGRSIDEINEFGEGEAGEAFEVTAEHFGAAGLAEAEADGEGPARKKTKAEVMMEVIAKSKQHKYERQMAKEEDDGLRRELDDDFESVRALLFASSGDAKPMQKAAAAAEGEDDAASNNADKSYDAHVREMVYEQRARPQNRLKTEEELARQEVERLERAERHRQRRMDGIPSDTEPESDSDGDEMAAYKAKQKRFPVADDLGDDFAKARSDSEDNSEDVDLGGGLAAAASQSGSDDDSGVSDDGSDVSDDGEEDEEEEPCAVPAKKTKATASSTASKEDAEMPYTFDAPSDYDAWVSLVGKYSLEQQLVVIRRLRTLYHIRLAPQNKQKLGDLAIILVDYIAVLAEQDPPIKASVVDEIVKHVGELAPIDADRFGEHCRLQVIEIQKRIADAIKGSGGSSQAAAAAALAASDIALMRVFVAVFSASDRFHSVITPMLVAIGQYLSQFAFATPASIAGALVLVGTVHEAQRLSRRLVPEALNFTFAALAASVCHADNEKDWSGQYPLSRRQRQAFSALLAIGVPGKCAGAVEPLRWSWLLQGSKSSFSTGDRYSVLNACLHLSRRFVDAYFSLPAFVELFAPLKELLAKVSERLPQPAHFKMQQQQQQAPDAVRKALSGLQAYVGEQLDQAMALRNPLRLQYHKPLAIGTVAPKFESAYSLDVHYDPDRDRNESLKLKRQINRERRGVIRELRRDAQFVAGQRLVEQREKDSAYAEKMKKAWSVLEDEQSQMKKMDKQRIKERKGKL